MQQLATPDLGERMRNAMQHVIDTGATEVHYLANPLLIDSINVNLHRECDLPDRYVASLQHQKEKLGRHIADAASFQHQKGK